MVALKELHRRLHSRNNKNLLNREVSPDDYDIDEIDKTEKIESEKKTPQPDEEKVGIKEISDKDNLIQEPGNNNDSDNPQQPPKNNSINNSGFKNPTVDEDFGIILNGENEISKDNFMSKKIKIAAGVILALLLVVSGAIAYIKYKQGSFKPENIFIEFQGDSEIKSGDLLIYKLLIKNENRTGLKDAVIKVSYPEELIVQKASFMRDGPIGSFYVDVGEIKSFETKEFELKFKVFSPYGGQPYLNIEFSYQPENFSSQFIKKENHMVDIKGSVISFSLISPKEVASGELIKFIGVLTNNSANDFDDLILEMEYIDDFQFESSGLESINEEKSKFKIPKLKVGEKREVEVLGSFVGKADSVKRMIGKIGILDENKNLSEISIAEEVVKLIPSRITLEQEIVSGIDTEKLTVETGSVVRHRIRFKNNSSVPLFDLVLKQKIEGILIDEGSVQTSNGYYNLNEKEIIWKASDVQALKKLNPGEEGFVESQYLVKKDFFPDSDKNQILKTQTKISSLNIDTPLLHNKEISTEIKTLKVKTNLGILVSGSFGEGPFKNNGPIPVKVGEETTFTIKISLKNSFNKISKPNLLIKLPSGIIWKNSFHRSSGSVNFNDRANELKWELNSLNSQVGYKNPTEELIFQIGFIPQNNTSVNDSILVNEVVLNGFEEFIDSQINQKVDNFKLRSIKDYDF